MIDPELSRLIRDAAEKLAALESQAHQAEMAKLRDLDNERVSIADAVQSRIIAATDAQNAVLAYRKTMPEPVPFHDVLFHEHDEDELGPKMSYAVPENLNGYGHTYEPEEDFTPPARAD